MQVTREEADRRLVSSFPNKAYTMNNLDFIKAIDTPSPLILRKRPDGGFRKHPSSFFKRRCLEKFPSPCLQDISKRLKMEAVTLKLFMSAEVDVDIELAEKLEAATKIDAATWLELQRQFDEYKKN
tara:strand:- start:4398 stop:4775 length:378 start_codon:yes stop_codon:yes gene_type:complete